MAAGTALPTEPRSLPGLRLAAVRMASLTMTARTLTVAILIELSAGLAEREVRRLALGSVPFRPRQLRANQRTMDRPFVAFVPFLKTVFRFGRLRFGRRGEFTLLHRFAAISGHPSVFSGHSLFRHLNGFGYFR